MKGYSTVTVVYNVYRSSVDAHPYQLPLGKPPRY